MAEVAREVIANNIIECKDSPICGPEKAYYKDNADGTALTGQSSSSSYLLAEDRSTFSRDIDHWMNGGHPATPSSTVDSGNNMLNMRPALVQRSVLARSSSLDSQGLWCVLAMILPLFSMSCPHWRCTPSLMLNTAELLMTHCGRIVAHARTQIRQLSQDQVAREIFATMMDVVLVIYAIGFLVLSLYQASIFG